MLCEKYVRETRISATKKIEKIIIYNRKCLKWVEYLCVIWWCWENVYYTYNVYSYFENIRKDGMACQAYLNKKRWGWNSECSNGQNQQLNAVPRSYYKIYVITYTHLYYVNHARPAVPQISNLFIFYLFLLYIYYLYIFKTFIYK